MSGVELKTFSTFEPEFRNWSYRITWDSKSSKSKKLGVKSTIKKTNGYIDNIESGSKPNLVNVVKG